MLIHQKKNKKSLVAEVAHTKRIQKRAVPEVRKSGEAKGEFTPGRETASALEDAAGVSKLPGCFSSPRSLGHCQGLH